MMPFLLYWHDSSPQSSLSDFRIESGVVRTYDVDSWNIRIAFDTAILFLAIIATNRTQMLKTPSPRKKGTTTNAFQNISNHRQCTANPGSKNFIFGKKILFVFFLWEALLDIASRALHTPLRYTHTQTHVHVHDDSLDNSPNRSRQVIDPCFLVVGLLRKRRRTMCWLCFRCCCIDRTTKWN